LLPTFSIKYIFNYIINLFIYIYIYIGCSYAFLWSGLLVLHLFYWFSLTRNINSIATQIPFTRVVIEPWMYKQDIYIFCVRIISSVDFLILNAKIFNIFLLKKDGGKYFICIYVGNFFFFMLIVFIKGLVIGNVIT